ncbi:MAG: [FeFe] hydrogenase H-cluster radical SAM maturase HydE [Spirochaetales bacterium]|nr:[FeFe] hydrogenase H-cluster radical SAM maturase HydE [Spirochaetales bacterium]
MAEPGYKDIEQLMNDDFSLLRKQADQVCREHYGNKVFLRGLIEFSNYCDMDCLYCGLRRSNKHVQRYRLEVPDILSIVKKGYNAHMRTFVLQSGEDPSYGINKLCELIKKIKIETNDEAAVTLSCGIRTKEEYKILKKAGADRYLIRFETSDSLLHVYLRNGITLKRRLQAIDDLKSCDFEIGSGFMVGLPGETKATMIRNALLCKELDLDMIGIGPFIPHHLTPLKYSVQSPIEQTLRLVSIIRLLLPEANIPATTSMGTLDPYGREKALQAGANVLMPNITPASYKKSYLLYPGKICLEENGFECINYLDPKIKSVGKEISFDIGYSKHFIKKGVYNAAKNERLETRNN